MSPAAVGGGRPEHVGILAADVYFPSTFVTQVKSLLRVTTARVYAFAGKVSWLYNVVVAMIAVIMSFACFAGLMLSL